MLRTATPPTVRNVGRDPPLRLANSTSGAIASRRFKACAFCFAEKLRGSGSGTSGREANSLDWFGSGRSARAVQSGPDSSGCLRNFSCASTGKDDRAYSRWPEPRFCPLLVFRKRDVPSCTFQRIVRSDHPVTLLTTSLLIHSSAPTFLNPHSSVPCRQTLTKLYAGCGGQRPSVNSSASSVPSRGTSLPDCACGVSRSARRISNRLLVCRRQL